MKYQIVIFGYNANTPKVFPTPFPYIATPVPNAPRSYIVTLFLKGDELTSGEDVAGLVEEYFGGGLTVQTNLEVMEDYVHSYPNMPSWWDTYQWKKINPQ